MGAIFLIINVLASLHDQCHRRRRAVRQCVLHRLSARLRLLPINIILCAFGGINGIQLCIMPITFMNTWFGAPPEDGPKDYKAKKFMGLEVMPDNAAMTFFARNVGIPSCSPTRGHADRWRLQRLLPPDVRDDRPPPLHIDHRQQIHAMQPRTPRARRPSTTR